jgi:cytidyltransferase-like protein
MLHTYQKPLRGKKVGVVFGSFAPLHQGHLDLIMRAKKENDGGCIVIV